MTAPTTGLAHLTDRYREAVAHLAQTHGIHRGGTAGQLVAWHDQAHWLACTPTHNLPVGQEDPR